MLSRSINAKEHLICLLRLTPARGKVWGQTYERKRQEEFIAFLEYLERELPSHITKVHVVLDNLRRPLGKKVQAWLTKHPRFVFHHPPVH